MNNGFVNNNLSWQPYGRSILNWLVTVGSVVLCLLISPTRLPGMELAGIGPNWLLIWVVAWSVKRTVLQGAIAGLALGLLQDGMTAAHPTHVLSLVIVGALTARLQKQRYIQEDFISVALIVFGMAVLAETVTAIQYSLPTNSYDAAFVSQPDLISNVSQTRSAYLTLGEVWVYHQRIALSSAILSSLWAPVIYFPLNRWWERMNLLEQA